MSDEIDTKNCNDDDIISFNDEICKIKKFKAATKDYYYSSSNNYVEYMGENLNNIGWNIYHENDRRFTANYQWFNSGKKCELLQEGKRWKTGKIRIKLTLEFIPDEPEPEEIEQNNNKADESLLDEIRQQLTDEN